MALLEGDELSHRLENADFFRFKHMNRYYKSLVNTGLTTFNHQQAYKVEGSRNNGHKIFFFFAKSDGKLIGTQSAFPVEGNVIENTTTISGFAEHGNITLATEFFESSPQSESLTKFTDITFEVIPDSEFEPPREIQSP